MRFIVYINKIDQQYIKYQEMQNLQNINDDRESELNKIIDVLLDKSLKDSPEVKQSLSSLFDLLLWAEKRNEKIVKTVIQSKLMIIILQKYKELINLFVSGYTILLGNAKDHGILVMHLLQNYLPNEILRLYLNYIANLQQMEEQEHLHLLGSYLKAYHRHLTEQTIEFFIQNERSIMITICCKFFNCPEEITRTSIMNILMNILKLPFSSKLFAYPKIRLEIKDWCMNMCRLLRNQLKDFDQNLLTTQQSQGQYIIHVINDKIILWEDLSGLSQQLFSQAFYNEIIIPLVIGSLNTNGIPLFTLKFSLFILHKLIKTISNLDLINELGSLLFVNQTVTYKDNQLGTASLKPFKIHKIVSNQQDLQSKSFNQDDYQMNQFQQINQFFFNILRSKDSRFLECVCILIMSILTQMKTKPKYINFYIKQLGFGANGFNTIAVSQILINQFNALHSLQINRMVCSLLIFVQPTKYLSDQVKFRFTHMYKLHIDQAIKNIDKFKEKYDYISQVFQYDAKAISSNLFSFQMELKSDAALLFNNEVIENQNQSFYKQIPQTDKNLLRYSLVKTLLLRKISIIVIQQCSNDRTIQRYLERCRANDAKYIRPGEFLKLPINCNSYRCKLLDQKIEIPDCLLLEEDNNFILGFVEKMQIKIIINIKIKHINVYFKAKKDKIIAEIQIRKYDLKTEDLIQMKGIILKNIDVGVEYFKIKNYEYQRYLKECKKQNSLNQPDMIFYFIYCIIHSETQGVEVEDMSIFQITKKLSFQMSEIARFRNYSIKVLNKSHLNQAIEVLAQQFNKKQPLSLAYYKKYPQKSSESYKNWKDYWTNFCPIFFENGLSVGCFDLENNQELAGTLLGKDMNVKIEYFKRVDLGHFKYPNIFLGKQLIDTIAPSYKKQIINNPSLSILQTSSASLKDKHMGKNLLYAMMRCSEHLGALKGYHYELTWTSNIKSAKAVEKLKYQKISEVDAKTFSAGGIRYFQQIDDDNRLQAVWLKKIEIQQGLQSRYKF